VLTRRKYEMQATSRTYKELCETYKIAHSTKIYKDGKCIPINPDDYDVIVEALGSGYACSKYKIIKKTSDVTWDEIANICDRGGYNFGYRLEGNVCVIYTD
jgi:hypothetical protein